MFDGRIISGITVFVAVARSGSYARAAEYVGLSRSGIGKSIARLEYRTGLRLFDRTSRALKLTAEGRAFLNEVAPLLDRLGKAAAPAQPNKVRGHLRVVSDAAFGPYLLMPVLHRLMEQHPGLKIDLLVRDRIDNPIAEAVDVAVRFGEPVFPNVQKRLVMQSRVLTCATPAYLARHGTPSHPDELLEGHTCIRLLDDVTRKPHNWGFVTRQGERRRIMPDCNLMVNDAPSLMAGIESGYGIGRVLDFIVEQDLQAGRLIEILPEWNWKLWPAYIYTPAGSHPSAGLEAFTAFVLSQRFGPESSAR
jgi:DNA-binding transcriptional LysR family regulator